MDVTSTWLDYPIPPLGIIGDALSSWIIILGTVVLASSLSAFLMTHHMMRRLRRNGPSKPSVLLPGRRSHQPLLPLSVLGVPRRWMAVRADHPEIVYHALGMTQPETCQWQEGLARAAAGHLFIAPPFRGWILVFGTRLPLAFDDIDAFYARIRETSAALGEVQYFSMDQSTGHHAWMRLVSGQIVRSFVWAGKTLWQEGAFSAAESSLGMVCPDYGDQGLGLPNYETARLLDHNLAQLPALAARWSVDPLSLRQADLSSGMGVVGEWNPIKV